MVGEFFVNLVQLVVDQPDVLIGKCDKGLQVGKFELIVQDKPKAKFGKKE